MPSDKDGFVSYKSHFKVLEHLSDEQLGQLLRAVYQYQISGAEPAKDSPIYFPFAFMKLSFDADDLKYQAVIERNKNNGAKGGRPATNPAEPKKPNGLSGNPDEPKKADKDKDKDIWSSNEDGASPPPAGKEEILTPKSPDPAKHAAVVLTDPADEQHWSEGPLTKPAAFQAICERLGFLDIDFEYYRRAALVAAEDGDISRTIKQWNTWVRRYLENQSTSGPLLKPTAGRTLPTKATPRDQLPKPKQEKPGQIIYIDGVPGDQNMDRMKAASLLNHFPTAVVVSLAYPQVPYQSKP